MAVKTVVINNSDMSLQLKEGNGGVYRYLTTLKASNGIYTIKCNINATFREYWVGTGLDDGDDAVLTITSDDCVEYQTVNIINDPDNHSKLKLHNVKRGVKETAVVNQTGGDVKVLKSGSVPETHVLKTGEKFVIKRDPEKTKDCNYSVEAGGETIKISNQKVAKAQRINISLPGQANTLTPGQAHSNTSIPGQAKVDTVSRRVYLTEVTNKTNVAITVKHHKGGGGLWFWRGGNTPVEVTLEADKKITIEYDPKKGRSYSVEYAAGPAPSTPAGAAGAAPNTAPGAAPSTPAGGAPNTAAPSTPAGVAPNTAAPSTPAGVAPNTAAPSTPAGAVGAAPNTAAGAAGVALNTAAGAVGAAPNTAPGAAPSTPAGAAPSTPAGAAPSTHEPVWIASTDFADFKRIDIVTKDGGMELDLEKLEPRPSLGTNEDGFVSRLLSIVGF